MKWKRFLLDPSFWILFIVNIFLVVKYLQNPGIFTTLVWLYWSQNVLYGLFNFADILTSKNVDVSGGAPILNRSKKNIGATNLPAAQNTVKTDKEIANDMAWGFLFMFGFFHLVISVFLFSMDKTGPFDWGFFEKYLLITFVSLVIIFIQHKLQNREKAANVTLMSVLPYLRVVPVHLCILIPALFHLSNLVVFLILKVIIDVITFVRTARYYKKEDLVTDVTAMGINSNLSSEDF